MMKPRRNICSHPEVDVGLQEQAPRTLWGLRFGKKNAFIVP